MPPHGRPPSPPHPLRVAMPPPETPLPTPRHGAGAVPPPGTGRARGEGPWCARGSRRPPRRWPRPRAAAGRSPHRARCRDPRHVLPGELVFRFLFGWIGGTHHPGAPTTPPATIPAARGSHGHGRRPRPLHHRVAPSLTVSTVSLRRRSPPTRSLWLIQATRGAARTRGRRPRARFPPPLPAYHLGLILPPSSISFTRRRALLLHPRSA